MTARPGDPGLNTYIYERVGLIALATRIVDSHAVAEEIVQESWLRWHRKDYPITKARAIFRRVVANLAKDRYRRLQKEHQVLRYANWHDLDAPDSERLYIARQDLHRAIQALQELPKRSVRAYRMHCMDGLSCAEIGRQLGLSRSRAHALVEDVIVHVTIRLSEK